VAHKWLNYAYIIAIIEYTQIQKPFMSFFKHVALHKYDLTDKGVSQACYDEMKAEGYDLVISEKEMQVLAKHRCEEFKNYMRPLFA
jgi:hypothetical protein